jgi:hypothetical protein
MTFSKLFQPLGQALWLRASAGGPDVVKIDGIAYERFMDRIYIPCPTSELTPAQIAVISRFRETHLQTDSQFKYRKLVRRMTVRVIQEIGSGNLLEIGCGRFPLSKEMKVPITEYVGIDIDPVAVAANKANGVSCYMDVSDVYDRLSRFDLVVALFVAQFHLPDALIVTLARNTAADAVILFNVITKEINIRHAVASQLSLAGMWVRGLPIESSLAHDTFFVSARSAGLPRAQRAVETIEAILAESVENVS